MPLWDDRRVAEGRSEHCCPRSRRVPVGNVWHPRNARIHGIKKRGTELKKKTLKHSTAPRGTTDYSMSLRARPLEESSEWNHEKNCFTQAPLLAASRPPLDPARTPIRPSCSRRRGNGSPTRLAPAPPPIQRPSARRVELTAFSC